MDGRYWVLEMGPITRVRNMRGGFGSYRNYCKVLVFENDIWNQGFVEGLVVGMDVARGDWEGEVVDLSRKSERLLDIDIRGYSHKCSENIVPSIKLVVPNGHGIEAKLIECVRNLLTPVETVE